MKKLMITAAAAMTAMVGFCTIESSNVVGYASTGLRQNFTAGGAQFLPMTGSGIDLTDMKVLGYDPVEGCEGDVNVQILNPNGGTETTYTWYDLDGEYYGWYDDEDNEIAPGTVFIKPGEGLWINAPSSEYSIQSAGQVADEDVSVALRANFKMVGNPNPIAVDLTDIIVSGYDPEEGCEGDVNAQILTANGRTETTYTWYDLDGEYYGWYDDEDNEIPAKTVMIGAGSGLWVFAPSTAYSITFPSAL